MDEREYRAAMAQALRAGNDPITEVALKGQLHKDSFELFVLLLEEGYGPTEFDSRAASGKWRRTIKDYLLRRVLDVLATNRTVTTLILANLAEQVAWSAANIDALRVAVTGNMVMTTLCLPNNGLWRLDAASLAAVCAGTGYLTLLDLSHNELTPANGRALAVELHGNTRLRHLDLHHNRLGTACRALAAMLRCNTSLCEVDLSRNNMGVRAMEFESVISMNRTLRRLHFCNGHPVGMPFVCKITAVLKTNYTLLSIDLPPHLSEAARGFLMRNRRACLMLHSLRMAAAVIMLDGLPRYRDREGCPSYVWADLISCSQVLDDDPLGNTLLN